MASIGLGFRQVSQAWLPRARASDRSLVSFQLNCGEIATIRFSHIPLPARAAPGSYFALLTLPDPTVLTELIVPAPE